MKILFVASLIIGLVCQGYARSMGPMEILKQGANMIKDALGDPMKVQKTIEGALHSAEGAGEQGKKMLQVAVKKAQQEEKKFEAAIKDPTKFEENAKNQIEGAVNAAAGLAQQEERKLQVDMRKAQQEVEAAVNHPKQFEKNAEEGLQAAEKDAEGFVEQEEEKLKGAAGKLEKIAKEEENIMEDGLKDPKKLLPEEKKMLEGEVKKVEEQLEEAIQNPEHAAEEAAKKAEGLTGTGLHRRSHKEAESSNVHSSKQEDLLKKLQVQLKVLVAKTIAMIKKISEKMSHY